MIEYTVRVASNSTKWLLNGRLHREDGPAIEWADGGEHWYLTGVRYSKEEWDRQLNPKINLTIAAIEVLLGYRINIVS